MSNIADIYAYSFDYFNLLHIFTLRNGLREPAGFPSGIGFGVGYRDGGVDFSGVTNYISLSRQKIQLD